MFSKTNPTTLVFDWGNTVMKEFPQYPGAMVEWPEVAAVDGIKNALDQLDSKYRMVIGTNAQASSSQQVREALKRVGLGDEFEYIFTYAETKSRKPDVNFFRSIERMMGEYRDGMVMIGDSYPVDIIGAKRAGWKAIWYNPQNLPCPTCMPFHDIEIDHFDSLAEALKEPALPDLKSCILWLQEFGVSANILVHVQLVAAAAYQMALWVRAQGEKVNPVLAHRGGLLHDLAKLRKKDALDHGAAARKILEEAGEPVLAKIADRHMLFGLSDPDRCPQTWEEKLVYYADKLVEKNQLVLIEERIAGLKKRYPMDPSNLEKILPMLKKLELKICSTVKRTPEELLVDLQHSLHQ